MQTTAVVYLLSSALDLVLHSCLHSAILQLSSLSDEYAQFVSESGRIWLLELAYEHCYESY
jgi:hypothetical protein